MFRLYLAFGIYSAICISFHEGKLGRKGVGLIFKLIYLSFKNVVLYAGNVFRLKLLFTKDLAFL